MLTEKAMGGSPLAWASAAHLGFLALEHLFTPSPSLHHELAVRSIRYKGWLSRVAIVIFVVSFVTLGVLGVMPPTHERTIIAQLATVAYFAFFILMPLYTRFETTRAVPDRVTGR